MSIRKARVGLVLDPEGNYMFAAYCGVPAVLLHSERLVSIKLDSTWSKVRSRGWAKSLRGYAQLYGICTVEIR